MFENSLFFSFSFYIGDFSSSLDIKFICYFSIYDYKLMILGCFLVETFSQYFFTFLLCAWYCSDSMVVPAPSQELRTCEDSRLEMGRCSAPCMRYHRSGKDDVTGVPGKREGFREATVFVFLLLITNCHGLGA